MAGKSALFALIERGSPSDVALAAPGRDPLTYAGLRSQVQYVADRLAQLGCRPDHRIALVLPNGPDMAVAFLGTAIAAAAVPLNPGFRRSELECLLRELRPAAVIVSPPAASALVDASEACGVAILQAVPESDQPAGIFRLEGAKVSSGSETGRQDALILHTSGTTARPKQVPLTEANLCAGVAGLLECLSLTAEDCCLSVMPMFHIHGLMAGILAPLAAGGSLFAPRRFSALGFFEWLDQSRATWYTAVPTMHQALLARSDSHGDIIRRRPLRFIRSSSAPLPGPVYRDLERVFAAPVLTAYGMTEASHQVTGNSSQNGGPIFGTVGIPWGLNIAVMQNGATQPRGVATGEIVIRGPSVMGGYLDDPPANQDAFADGWFKTGDEGTIDAGGRLTLTGRLKEMINRGGEKISPFEIEDVLLAHPAVEQAVCFAVPHPMLGQDITAAVVLRPGFTATVSELQRLTRERLANWKVPRQILTVDKLPHGATGKVQRTNMARLLNLEP